MKKTGNTLEEVFGFIDEMKQLGIEVGVWDANSESIRKTMREIVRKSSAEEAKKWYREKIILRNGALKNPKFTPEEAKEWYQKNIVALQKKMADKNK